MLYDNGLWSMDIPSAWIADEDDYSTSFYDPEGAGALQVNTSKHSSGDVSHEELERAAQMRVAEDVELEPTQLGDFSGVCTETEGTNNFRREWWVAAGDTILHIAYTCAMPDQDAERDDVDAALESLKRAPADAVS
jgi:hypothetical protein